MSETPEGIGSQKWSYQIEGGGEQPVKYILSQGAIKLAELHKSGEQFKLLLVTCPQLWEAANVVVKLATEIAIKNNEMVHPEIRTLGQFVAKAVGKENWTKVLQS